MTYHDPQGAHRHPPESVERLREQNEEQRQIISLIAHDLKTPMSTIVSFCRILRENCDALSREELLRMVDDMESTARNGNQLLHNLLRWAAGDARPARESSESFSIRVLADEAARMLESTAQAQRIAIRNAIEDELLVAADREMIDAVLRNLLSNAIKFSRAGSEIILESRRETGRAVITVRDSGIGIESDRLAMIFRSLDAAGGTPAGRKTGSGLGLRLCAEFVRKNGGEIRVQSAPGQGTAISFSLPTGDRISGRHPASGDEEPAFDLDDGRTDCDDSDESGGHVPRAGIPA